MMNGPGTPALGGGSFSIILICWTSFPKRSKICLRTAKGIEQKLENEWNPLLASTDNPRVECLDDEEFEEV